MENPDKAIEEKILEFGEEPLPALVPRRMEIPALAELSKAVCLVGVRRCGKTFLFFQLINGLLSKGVQKQDILYFNFEDERLDGLKAADLHLLVEKHDELFPGRRDRKKYLFLDEIQTVDGFERFVRRLLDSRRYAVFLTGSSAKLLSKEIATSLRGRSVSYEVFPCDFSEFLIFSGAFESVPATFSPSSKSRLRAAYRRYLRVGGFPEVVGLHDLLREKVHSEYLNALMFRDLIQRHQIQAHALLKRLIKHLVNNSAARFSVNKFFNDLRSQGYRLSKNTLYDFLDYIQDVYLSFQCPIYSESIRKQEVNPKKAYCVDVGLVHSVSEGLQSESGRMLENLVFLELRRRGGEEVYYYMTKEGLEVDFHSRGGLYQVCERMNDPETRARELRALGGAMKELGLKESTIITADHEETLHDAGRTVHATPYWKWAMGR